MPDAVFACDCGHVSRSAEEFDHHVDTHHVKPPLSTNLAETNRLLRETLDRMTGERDRWRCRYYEEMSKRTGGS